MDCSSISIVYNNDVKWELERGKLRIREGYIPIQFRQLYNLEGKIKKKVGKPSGLYKDIRTQKKLARNDSFAQRIQKTIQSP